MTALTDPAERATEAESGVELFEIKSRWNSAVLFEAELSAEVSPRPFGIKLGAAVKLALEAGVNLAGADLAGANLVRADLAGANLTRADLAGANLANANLARADLAGANLTGADLASAKLVYAYLVHANLTRAYLVRASLGRADLAGAILTDADLAGADLTDADLINANLAGANLTRANLAGVRDVIAAGQPNGFWAFGYRERKTGVLRVKVGCHDKSMVEAREYWSVAHTNWSDRQEIPVALEMIEVVARVRGWELPQ